MGKVEKYCDLLIRSGATNLNESNRGGIFLDGHKSRLTPSVGLAAGTDAGEFMGTVMNHNELAVIFAFEPHPVTFA
jgi:hypothetical protein